MKEKEENIRKYASLMTELGLTAIEISEGDSVIRLERSPAPASIAVSGAVASEADAMHDSPHGENADENIVSVLSPMVGMFYAAPAENAEHFVSVGKRVKTGDTLCIIEAMKLMNEIKAECDGVITEICVTNGQTVDYGCELFKIKR